VSVWKYPGKFGVFLFVSILDHASQLTCALILPFEYSLKRLSMSICQESTVPFASIVNVTSDILGYFNILDWKRNKLLKIGFQRQQLVSAVAIRNKIYSPVLEMHTI